MSADGVIIGGLEDGSVGFWNASKIVSSAPQYKCGECVDLANDDLVGPSA